MNGVRLGWLVALREIRERGRSRALWVSILVTIVAVAGMVAVPALFTSGGSKDVGLAGSAPAGLSTAIQSQGSAVGTSVRIRSYPDTAAGEAAVRRGEVDVLVVDAKRLEWRRQPDQQLRVVVTDAILLVAVRERAAAAGISPGALADVLAPVPVTNVELGAVTGRTPGDEAAALVMTMLLLLAIATYGGLVLTGVVEEKSSRVVEVLLAHVPARSLLAGKVTGIGLIGLAQIAVTALAALIATAAVRSVDIPAIRGGVLAWAIVWFLLGYALYAVVYGALGSLASRTEDAQTAAGPVTTVLVAGSFLSFIAVGRPDSGFAKAVSFFPATAPMAMPNRIAMGAAAWWEPPVAALLTLATIAVLVVFAGHVYNHAILHTGPALKLRDAWRGTPGTGTAGTGTAGTGAPRASRPRREWLARQGLSSRLVAALLGVGGALGIVVGVLTRDVVWGLAAGIFFYAAAERIAKTWTGHRSRHGHSHQA